MQKNTMAKPQFILQCLLLLACSGLIFHSTLAVDTALALQYMSPYLPTACAAGDQSQFPSNNLFAAVGEKLWDSGAACGRQYEIGCRTGPIPGICKAGQVIRVTVVDKALPSMSNPTLPGTPFVLSTTAFQAIANPSTDHITIDYTRVH